MISTTMKEGQMDTKQAPSQRILPHLCSIMTKNNMPGLKFLEEIVHSKSKWGMFYFLKDEKHWCHLKWRKAIKYYKLKKLKEIWQLNALSDLDPLLVEEQVVKNIMEPILNIGKWSIRWSIILTLNSLRLIVCYGYVRSYPYKIHTLRSLRIKCHVFNLLTQKFFRLYYRQKISQTADR